MHNKLCTLNNAFFFYIQANIQGDCPGAFNSAGGAGLNDTWTTAKDFAAGQAAAWQVCRSKTRWKYAFLGEKFLIIPVKRIGCLYFVQMLNFKNTASSYFINLGKKKMLLFWCLVSRFLALF